MSKLFIVCEDCNEFVPPGNIRHETHKTADLVPDTFCGICEKKILFGEPKTSATGKEVYHNRCLTFSPISSCGFCHKLIPPEILQWKNRVAYDEACYSRLFFCKECGEEIDPLKDRYDASGSAYHQTCLPTAVEAVSPENLKEICCLWIKVQKKFAQDSEKNRALMSRAYKAEQETFADIKKMDGKLGLSVILPKPGK